MVLIGIKEYDRMLKEISSISGLKNKKILEKKLLKMQKNSKNVK